MQSKSILGPYSSVKDEAVHCLLGLLPAALGYLYGLSFFACVFIFLASSFLVDADHVFNSLICKKFLKIPGYQGTLTSCDKGCVPNIFHGFDIAAVFCIAAGAYFGPLFGLLLFCGLSLHLLWDFVIYPFKPTLLFLTARASMRFQIGERARFKGRIFDLETLKY